MQLRIGVWATILALALTFGASSAAAFNPQPDPPGRSSLAEKVHLPVYDSAAVLQIGR